MYNEGVINYTSQHTDCVVNFDAAIHVIAKKELFSSYTLGDYGILRTGNDGLSKVIDIGNICLRANNDSQLLLRDVRHALYIKLNLISVARLDDDSFSISFEGEKWKLSKGSLIVAREKKYSKLYLT